jgi:hypothetical protein
MPLSLRKSADVARVLAVDVEQLPDLHDIGEVLAVVEGEEHG